MKLDRFRAPALAATAVLLISGVASAFAASPAPAAPVTVAPITQPAADPVAAEPAQAGDTDTLQAGDQTAQDVPGAAESKAETPEAAGIEAPEAASAEKDGPGGHADADGANVDHQFEGEE